MTAILELRGNTKRQSRVDNAAGLWIGNRGRSFLHAHKSIMTRVVPSIAEPGGAGVDQILSHLTSHLADSQSVRCYRGSNHRINSSLEDDLLYHFAFTEVQQYMCCGAEPTIVSSNTCPHE